MTVSMGLFASAPLRWRVPCMVFLCLLALVITCVMALGLGEFHIAPTHVVNALWQDDLSDTAFVIRELRLPRLLTGVLVGAALGLAGALVQALTRNPLGEPGLLGVTAGAAFATALCMAWFSLPLWAELALGTVGGIAAAALTLTIASGARLEPLYLTLTGMSVNLFFAAAIVVLLVSSDVPAGGLYYWLSGSLLNRTWQHVDMLWPWVLAGLVLGLMFSGKLDVLRLDEDILASLGMRAARWRLLFGIAAVLLAAASVAAAGPVTFVGLMAPHIVRFGLAAQGISHRVLLPLSALVGAALVGSADVFAKWQEIPVGILCVLLGGPILVYLIGRHGAVRDGRE